MSNEAAVAACGKSSSSEAAFEVERKIQSVSLTQSFGMVNYLSLDASLNLRDANALLEGSPNVWETWRVLLTPDTLYLSLEQQLILDQIPLVGFSRQGSFYSTQKLLITFMVHLAV